MDYAPSSFSFDPDAAISVRGICKRYRLGVIDRKSFRDELIYRWLRLLGKDPKESMGKIGDPRLKADGWFHALDNVSFDIRKGEAVGLIGRNGAGKSTMLKILARITEPDNGSAVIRGRVGSLLEVGTGFHPELTGRENIYLNGTILGMKKREIDAKFDEIVDFAEIGPFLDTPVKRYSSGMHVTLAFSVAVCLDTDVLLVDEVLAVGDLAFRQKSLERMKNLVKSGRTLIFVSHMIPQIKKLCSRCIWFKDGHVFKKGPAGEIADEYVESLHLGKPSNPAPKPPKPPKQPPKPPKPPPAPPKPPPRTGTGPVRVRKATFQYNRSTDEWEATVDYEVSGEEQWPRPHVKILVRRAGERGAPAFAFDTATMRKFPRVLPSSGSVSLCLPQGFRFPPGKFTAEIRLWYNGHTSDIFPDALSFEAEELDDLSQNWGPTPENSDITNVPQDWTASPC